MKSSTAKALAGGKKITKVVTWDSMSQRFEDPKAPLLRSASILVVETGRYHEDGVIEEEGWRLSEVLDTDLVMEIHTEDGKVWETRVNTVGDFGRTVS